MHKRVRVTRERFLRPQMSAPTNFWRMHLFHMDIVISLLITFVLIVVNGYFSMAEMALSTAKKALLERASAEGDVRGAIAVDAVENPDGYLAAIQVAITLVGFASSVTAATNLSTPVAQLFASWGMSLSFAHAIAPALITLVISYISIVIGELVPKRMALSDAERIAMAVAGPLLHFSTLARPLVWLTSASAEGIASLLHLKDASDRQLISEDEIKYLVTDTQELSDEEKSMIHDVIGLGDTIAREVMVPRVDMTAVEDTQSCREALDIMRTTGYSRLPVYHEEVDHIVGIAHIKDLIEVVLSSASCAAEKTGEQAADAAASKTADEAIVAHMRKAEFVPDTKDIIPLLSEMRASHVQMAIIVDEYGGTAGVVTIEDIVEEVVGEIEDEFDPDNRYITQINDRTWLVDGRYSIDDAIELGWPMEDSNEYETLAGFVLELADSVPSAGDSFSCEGWTFTVQAMRGRRLAKIRVTAPLPDPEQTDGAGLGAGNGAVATKDDAHDVHAIHDAHAQKSTDV